MKIIRGLQKNQVLQRRGRSGARLALEGVCRGSGPVEAVLLSAGRVVEGFDAVLCGHASGGFFRARLSRIPAGGPYFLRLSVEGSRLLTGPFFCGDVWLLAGQSNMEGVGNIEGAARSHPWIKAFSLRRAWRRAADPLHILPESPDGCHNGGGQCSPETGESLRRTAQKGVGVGIFFAREQLHRSEVPQGLICTAHGGTSMSQWDPDQASKGPDSLYWSMIESVRQTGQPVAGVLWYQGESDANPDHVPVYLERMKRLVARTRRDLQAKTLPWVVVQIGKVYGVHQPSYTEAWNGVQDRQRRLPGIIPHLAVVASIDLPMDDQIHIGAAGFPLLGKRLALAMDSLAPRSGIKPPPSVAGITQVAGERGWSFAVSYRDVRRLVSDGEPQGFSLLDEKGRELPVIYKTALEANRVRLEILPPLGLRPELCRLAYGFGTTPVCTIRDERGFALPVFAPQPLAPPCASTPYLTRWRVSNVLPAGENLRAFPSPPAGLPTREKTAEDNGFVNEHENWIGQNGCAYFFAALTLPEPMTLAFKMGYDGPFALWVGKKLLFQDLHGLNPCVPDKASRTMRLAAGTHPVIVGMNLAHGRSWGFFLRLIRTDLSSQKIKAGNYRLPDFA